MDGQEHEPSGDCDGEERKLETIEGESESEGSLDKTGETGEDGDELHGEWLTVPGQPNPGAKSYRKIRTRAGAKRRPDDKSRGKAPTKSFYRR